MREGLLASVNQLVFRDRLFEIVDPSGQIWICIRLDITASVSVIEAFFHQEHLRIDIIGSREIRWVTTNVLRTFPLVNAHIVDKHRRREWQ